MIKSSWGQLFGPNANHLKCPMFRDKDTSNKERPYILPFAQKVCLGKQEDSIISSDGQLWSMASTRCNHIASGCINQMKDLGFSFYTLALFSFFFLTLIAPAYLSVSKDRGAYLPQLCIADSAQTEYCPTFHCSSVRVSVTGVTSYISHI